MLLDSVDNSISSINIGDVVYKMKEDFHTVYRVVNIYEYGCVIRNVTNVNEEDKLIYLEDYVKDYVRIKPHGYIELTAVKVRGRPYKDLRISAVNVLPDGTNHLVCSGLLLERSLYGQYPTYGTLADKLFDMDPRKLYVYRDVSPSPSHRVAISYYFGDTAKSMLNLMDEVLTNYVDMIYDEYDEYITMQTGVAKRTEHRYSIEDYIIDEDLIVMLLEDKSIVELHSEYNDFSIVNYKFADAEVFDNLVYEYRMPEYPYFVSEYKLYIDLNSIANHYIIGYAIMPNGNVRVYIIMTYLASYSEE